MDYTKTDTRALREELCQNETQMHAQMVSGGAEWMWTDMQREPEQSAVMEEVKVLLSAFWAQHGETEYEDEDGCVTCADFEDPYRVLLAHRDYNERWPWRPVVVTADLIHYRIDVMVSDMYLLHREQYSSLRQMVDAALRHLDYEELVYVSEAEFGLIENTSAKLKYLAYEQCDMEAWHALMQDTFPIPRQN